MSKIQVNEIVNHFDNGAPDCPKGFTVSSGISTFTGAIDANGSLDVDGHTNLDNVNISGVVTAASLDVTGNVSVGGTLTYEDVTSIDSVGIITAQSGIHVTGGVQVGTGATITGSTNIITASTNGSERVRIDSSGLIANNGRVPSSYGSPNLLISGTDSTLTLMGDGSTNSSSFTGIKFRVAGLSAGDYTKAGIFSRRESGYNDLSIIFALNTDANANSVAISDEKLRITSAGLVGINTTTGFDTSVGLAVRNGQSGSDHTMIDIIANTNETSRVVFSDDTDHNQGRIQYNHTGNSLGFYTNGENERLRLNGNGTAQFTPEGSTSNPYLLIDTSGDNVRLNAQKSSGNNGLIFLTQSSGTVTERMRIDSDGYITKPAHPCFDANLSSGAVTAGAEDPTPIIYNQTSVNNGSHYSTSNGRFTAPVAGIYQFWWGCIKNNVTAVVVRLQLQKNGTTYVNNSRQLRMDGSSSGVAAYGDNGAITVITSLAKDDYVRVMVTAGVAYGTGASYTYFCGNLIG